MSMATPRGRERSVKVNGCPDDAPACVAVIIDLVAIDVSGY
jgi:hypothetical protein